MHIVVPVCSNKCMNRIILSAWFVCSAAMARDVIIIIPADLKIKLSSVHDQSSTSEEWVGILYSCSGVLFSVRPGSVLFQC